MTIVITMNDPLAYDLCECDVFIIIQLNRIEHMTLGIMVIGLIVATLIRGMLAVGAPGTVGSRWFAYLN